LEQYQTGIAFRYDIAISTCCPALENVVVDTVETAQQCISFLKEKNFSRLTFIALDKQNNDNVWNGIRNKPET
jgi:structural maintenance of chromosome 4